MNEAGGKHYGNGCTPWHLQRDMQSWGSVFIDARRTDVIEYLFRKKGDKSKQLDDARKALHNCEEIIKELEKLHDIVQSKVYHFSHTFGPDKHCVRCGKNLEFDDLSKPCPNS